MRRAGIAHQNRLVLHTVIVLADALARVDAVDVVCALAHGKALCDADTLVLLALIHLEGKGGCLAYHCKRVEG